MENRKIDSVRVLDWLIYKNHYVLNENLHIFSGDHKLLFVCGRCSNCYPSQNV